MKKLVPTLTILLAVLLVPCISFSQAHPVADTSISGRAVCQTCHSGAFPTVNVYPGYMTTAHAGAYDSSAFLNKKSADCLQCHTTGWDTTKTWQGADEYVSIILNSAGLKDSVVVTNSTNFLQRVNVQCESCHKPPATTVAGFDTSLTANKCADCHGPKEDHQPTWVDWSKSLHSMSKYTSSGTQTLTATNPNCAGCHTADGFLQWVKDTTHVSPNIVVIDTTVSVGITCAACHNPHSGAIPHQLRLAAAKLCEKCHNPEYNADSAAVGTTPHHSTAYMFEGTGGWQYGTAVASSFHKTVITDKCVVCHMATTPLQAGPPVVPAYTGHQFTPQKGACKTCHADIDTTKLNPFDYRRTQTVTDSLASVLQLKLVKATKADSATLAFKRAQFNLDFYNGDGSHGIHNAKYAQGLLTLSIANFTPTGIGAIDLGKPFVYALNQNYPNPFNPSTMINFSIEKHGNVRLVVFDVLGRLVNTLVNQELGAGSYHVAWSGSDKDGAKVSSGIYFYRIESGSFTASKKMLLLK